MNARLRLVALWLWLGSGALGCSSDESSLVRARLSIEVSDGSGRHADVACEELPLLQGSHRYTRHRIDDALEIKVMAVPSQINLKFDDLEGKTLSRERTLSRGTLLLNDYAEEIDVLFLDGGIYHVNLLSGCER